MNRNVINTWGGRVERNKRNSSFHICQPPNIFYNGRGGGGGKPLKIVERKTFSEERRH